MAFDETYNEPESTEVLVKSLDPEHPAQLHYAHAGDAGADLITTVDVTLKPFERVLVPTGVAIALPAGYVALVHPRSGLAAKQGVTVLNAPGTVDAGYRGEIKVPLINLDPERTAVFHPGDRIAQLVIQRYVEVHPGRDTARIRSRRTWVRFDGSGVLTGLGRLNDQGDDGNDGCGTNDGEQVHAQGSGSRLQ